MLVLNDTVSVPPGGWRYYVRSTDTWIEAQSLDQLQGNVSTHLAANGHIVPPNLPERVENQICKKLAPGKCRMVHNAPITADTGLNLGQVTSGTLTVVNWFMRGLKRVSKEEADRRAAICISCPFNRPIQGCTSCAGNAVRKMIGDYLGRHETKYSEKLQYCVSCGCALKASVWAPLDIQQKYISKEVLSQLPDGCWKKPKTS